MSTTITESGMTFGPFLEENCFHIERCAAFTSMKCGVKMAEFLLLHTGKANKPEVWVVEAKSSSPKPENRGRISGFIQEIREKFVNAMSLCLACRLGRHSATEKDLPPPFKEFNISNVEFKFILVVKGHEQNWLPPLQDALSNAMRATISAWGFSPTAVAVLNEDGARKYKLLKH